MTLLAALVLGLLIGWLVEWIIDWLYWRNRNRALALGNRNGSCYPAPLELPLLAGDSKQLDQNQPARHTRRHPGRTSLYTLQNGGAYLWWQIKLPNGQIGWSAEASTFGAFYFMEPVR